MYETRVCRIVLKERKKCLPGSAFFFFLPLFLGTFGVGVVSSAGKERKNQVSIFTSRHAGSGSSGYLVSSV